MKGAPPVGLSNNGDIDFILQNEDQLIVSPTEGTYNIKARQKPSPSKKGNFRWKNGVIDIL